MRNIAKEMFEIAEKKNILFQNQHIQEILQEIEHRANLGLYKLYAELSEEEVLKFREMGFLVYYAEPAFFRGAKEYIIEWDFGEG